MGDLAPLDLVPWDHPSPQLKRHLDRFSRFCRDGLTTVTDRPTDRPTDYATWSVAIGRVYSTGDAVY